VTPRRCVVSVGIGGWFPRGVDRLERSLQAVGWSGGFMGWRNEWPPGSPRTEIHMHKPWAMLAALEAGYTSVMWLDASCWAVAPIEPIFQIAEHTGHYLVYNGFKVGQWSSDRCLELFGISREQAWVIEDIASGFVCLDLTHQQSRAFLNDWARYTLHQGGAAFVGADSNADGAVSKDPGVEGHRHDQTVASLILHCMGIYDGVRFGDSLIDAGKQPGPGKLITYHGM
jgi:hypothetical protein